MATSGKYLEIEANGAAKTAFDNFEALHRSKMDTILALAKMLSGGGWGAVQFDDGKPEVSDERRIESSIEPISLPISVGGEYVEQIVTEWKRLRGIWESAYVAIPEELRHGAPAPSQKGPASRSGRRRRE
jgi:hypothetical protein